MSKFMKFLSRTLMLCLLLAGGLNLYAEDIDFKEMSLEELRTFNVEELDKKQSKAHRKALRKATKQAEREARKNQPRADAYCNRLKRSRGLCS